MTFVSIRCHAGRAPELFGILTLVIFMFQSAVMRDVLRNERQRLTDALPFQSAVMRDVLRTLR